MSRIDRIRKLIALAASENEHEARSAAYLACKMIRDDDVRLVEPAAPDPWAERAREQAWRSRREPAARPPPPPPRDLRPRRESFGHGSDVAYPVLADDQRLGAVHADCRRTWTTLA